MYTIHTVYNAVTLQHHIIEKLHYLTVLHFVFKGVKRFRKKTKRIKLVQGAGKGI